MTAYACPHCGDRVELPRRTDSNAADVREYWCLPCSERTGRLVPRAERGTLRARRREVRRHLYAYARALPCRREHAAPLRLFGQYLYDEGLKQLGYAPRQLAVDIRWRDKPMRCTGGRFSPYAGDVRCYMWSEWGLPRMLGLLAHEVAHAVDVHDQERTGVFPRLLPNGDWDMHGPRWRAIYLDLAIRVLEAEVPIAAGRAVSDLDDAVALGLVLVAEPLLTQAAEQLSPPDLAAHVG